VLDTDEGSAVTGGRKSHLDLSGRPGFFVVYLIYGDDGVTIRPDVLVRTPVAGVHHAIQGGGTMSFVGGRKLHIHAALEDVARIRTLTKRRVLFSADELLDLTMEVATQTELWQPLIRHTTETRWYEALVLSDALELWLIGWTPGQATLLHDHGGAAGALTIAAGRLIETAHADLGLTPPRRNILDEGAGARFSPNHIHRVANEGARNATSIHAYSPAGLQMRVYGGKGETQLVAAGSAGSLS